MLRLLPAPFVFLIGINGLHAQRDGLVVKLPGDSGRWIRFTGAIQVWARYTEHNPATAVQYGTSLQGPPPAFDIGIRRARFQAFGQVAPRTFMYAQFGINNFHPGSPRKAGAFFHDLLAEYEVVPRALSTGGGLTGWSGLSRYASPSIGSTLMYDAPLFQQATNDVNEQFLRKLSLYAKGKLSRLDYRLALSRPMSIHQAVPPVDTALGGIAFAAKFSPRHPRLQYQAYVNWQFLDQENNLTPYTTGTYLGEKNVLNVGGGIIFQPEAMRHLDLVGNAVYTPMRLMAADVFFDHVVLAEQKTALTAYAGFFDYDFGPNHIRTLGVMNPANASLHPPFGKFSGPGNAYAMFGTGQILHVQSGYKMRDGLLNRAGTLQPYADVTVAWYDVFDRPVVVWNTGVNWLLRGQSSRISLNYQERPVFFQNPLTLRGAVLPSGRRGMAVLQYQAVF